MKEDNIEELARQSLFEEDFDDLDCEVFECFNCGWVGQPITQCSERGLWEGEEEMLLCPVCGGWLS